MSFLFFVLGDHLSARYLQLVEQILIVPDPTIASLFHSGASLADPPHSFRDGSRIVQVEFRKVLLDGIRSSLGLVVRNGRVKVVGHVGGANLVVQKINDSPGVHFVVWAINSVQGTLDKVVVVVAIVGHVDISVLQPVVHCGRRGN